MKTHHRCRVCGQLKTIDQFYKRQKGKETLSSECIPCKTLRAQEWRNANPLHCLTASARLRASRANVPFSINPKDLEPLVVDHCPVLGIPLDWAGFARGARSDNTPSLDRINPEDGYVPGNIAVISWRANRLKSDASLNELEALTKYIKKGTQ